MRIFAAASSVLNELRAVRYPWILVSYALDPDKILDELGYTPEALMIDSGAFTAWRQGVPIRNEDYLEWALRFRAEHEDADVEFFNLDVIGGEWGRPTTMKERNDAMTESLRHADEAREAGLEVVEVFHVFEPPDYLDQLLDRLPADGVLALAPRADRHRSLRTKWLYETWSEIFRRYELFDLPRIHGLGVSGELDIRAFPWESVDSTTYLVPGSRGRKLRKDGRQDWIADGYDEASTARRKNRDIQAIESIRILRRWIQRSRELSEFWTRAAHL